MSTEEEKLADLDEGAIEEVLRARAERLAKRPDTGAARRLLGRIVVVSVGKRQIGLPVERLRTIVRAGPVSVLPGLPRSMPGITHVRGELMSVVDVGQWLDGSGSEARAFLAVLDSDDGPLALCVDRVVGVQSVYEDEVATDVASGDTHRIVDYVTEGLVSVLSPARIFQQAELRLDARARRRGETRPGG